MTEISVREQVQPTMSDEDLALVSEEFESAPVRSIIAWAVDLFGDSLALAASFEDIVLIDLATSVAPGIEVVFLDTEAHFPETLSFVESVRARYDLNLTVTRPGPEAAAHPCGTDQCCQFRKVEPLRRKLRELEAWITSIRREQTTARARAHKLEWDDKFSLVKINPIADWTAKQVWRYIHDHDVPYNPLHDRSFPSIGCTHCTRAVGPGEDARAGRWPGFAKTECGLHAIEPAPASSEVEL